MLCVEILSVFLQKENLTKLFSPFGKIVDVSLMPNKKSGYVKVVTGTNHTTKGS